jgi:hypothetical protein
MLLIEFHATITQDTAFLSLKINRQHHFPHTVIQIIVDFLQQEFFFTLSTFFCSCEAINLLFIVAFQLQIIRKKALAFGIWRPRTILLGWITVKTLPGDNKNLHLLRVIEAKTLATAIVVQNVI